jgi:5'-3' exoribonuclease 1
MPFKINFEMGEPLPPLCQLLAVLPPESKEFLPEAYQPLVTSKESSIIHFFPIEVDSLLDDKNREWRNILLLPFVDESKLIQATSQVLYFSIFKY